MTRSIDAATLAELNKDNFNLATLVQFDFPTPFRITDWDRDITALNETWDSSPHIISLGNVTETAELAVNGFTIELSGVEQTYISFFLSNNYLDIPFKIYRSVLDNSDGIIGLPILVFDGLITGYEIEDSDDSSVLSISCASHWKDFEKENGRKTNHNSQQLHFPGDKGFIFAAKTVKDLRWGRT
jgi:hypothetical protein